MEQTMPSRMIVKLSRAMALAAVTGFLSLGTAHTAQATVVYSASLDASNGGSLNDYSPGTIGGVISAASGTANLTASSLIDYGNPGTTTSVGISGRTFSFDYSFSLSSATTASSYILQGSGNAISNFSMALYDSSKHLITTGIQGSGAAGQIVLSASNLGIGTYILEVTGALAKGSTLGGFSGNVSAVPLPGSLLLFGASLLILWAVSRFRRGTSQRHWGTGHWGMKTNLGICLLAVVGMLLGGGKAEASTLEIVNLGAVSQFSDTLILNGKDNASGSVSSKAYTILSNGSIGDLSQGTKSGSGSSLSYIYEFTLSKTSSVDMQLSGNEPGLTTTAFSLYSGTPSSAILKAASVTKPGTLEINASGLTAGSYFFEVTTQAVKNTSISGVGSISAVPIPGALVMFGTSLIGLAAYSRRQRSN